MIAGEGEAAVCYDCILVMGQVVEDENPPPPKKFELAKPMAPREIYSNLDSYVVGQEKAKKVLDRPNVILIFLLLSFFLRGPSGSGRTLCSWKNPRYLEEP